ncbi:hypothetical protein DFH08DRAFT_779446 [Mycena albidolilacea]|uniref:Uncharacterized protein n=1 Tax=Mycena albidolilacea TaxID=1033008 RepID=A0AAD7ES61_9AGAR|nr:hypothetical protein DFH08DRAFT_779446 [Mycena albidolilacea]
MKFLYSLVLSSFFATAAFAQNVVIGAPADGTTVTAGSNMTVEVDRPNSLTGSTEVAVVIGFLSCVGFSSETCPPASEILGSILYNGPYDPEFHTNVSRSKPPHQNFTVTIPATARTGPAQLSVTHLSLVGAGPFPLLETLNMTLNVENS